MLKPIREWTAKDVLRLRPVTQAYKIARYAHHDRRYRAQAGDPAQLAAVRAAITGRKTAVTIAFRDAEVIDWQIRLIRKYLPSLVHVIADNSPTDSAAATIRTAAERHGCPYVRLPRNPSTGNNPSRSHGLAMNWVWQNALLPAAPTAFGFLDHDIFPTAPDDPFATLAGLSFFGDVREAGGRWYLWAGYCFFDFERIRRAPLDFRPDWFIGLDTGGGNWVPLYSRFDRAKLPERKVETLRAFEDVPQDIAYYASHGTWLHEVGVGSDPAFKSRKRVLTARLLAPCLEGT